MFLNEDSNKAKIIYTYRQLQNGPCEEVLQNMLSSIINTSELSLDHGGNELGTSKNFVNIDHGAILLGLLGNISNC